MLLICYSLNLGISDIFKKTIKLEVWTLISTYICEMIGTFLLVCGNGNLVFNKTKSQLFSRSLHSTRIHWIQDRIIWLLFNHLVLVCLFLELKWLYKSIEKKYIFYFYRYSSCTPLPVNIVLIIVFIKPIQKPYILCT